MLSLPANPVRALAGSDPGRVRLTNAIAIASAVLLSTGSAIGITRLMHASTEYVTVGSFLAMIGGLSVKDATAHKRLATAALLALPALAMLSATALLDQWRYVEIALLVAVCTAATWVRRYGPRATAIGMVAFIAGFFGLIIRPSVDDLGVLALIVVATTACNVLVRLILLHGFPRHELRVLMREFRGACDTGLSAAEKGSSPALQKALDRISGVSVAVHGWQEGYDTRDCTGLDEAELSRLVFDARTDTVQACLQIAARPPTERHRDLVDALHRTVRSDGRGAPADALADAQSALADDPTFVRTVLAKAVLSQSTLQRALTDPTWTPDPEPDTAPAPAAPMSTPPSVPTPHRHFWDSWAPTTRMAVQVAIATTLATLVGELISASRWYWAVLTAFLVFVGTTTRGAILTRAYRRVLGTALGVVVGFGIAWFADGLDYTLAISCVICVFFIVYLGPLNYAFMAFFVTVLIASMYGLLGVLNRQVLEWRIEETAAGAAIGVVAAFVIFSTSSRPALESKLRGYFDSLDTLLARSGRAMTGAGRADDVVAAANALGIAHDDLRSFVALMEMSLADRDNRRLRRKATTLIRNAGTQAERLAEVAVRLNRCGDVFTGADAATIDACVAALRTQTAAACETLVAADTSDTEADTTALDGVNGIDVDGMSLRFGAVLAMSEMSASLQQLGRIRESAWPIADGEARRRPLRRRRR